MSPKSRTVTTRIYFKGLRDGEWIDITDRVTFSGGHAVIDKPLPRAVSHVRAEISGLIPAGQPFTLTGYWDVNR